MKVSVIEPVIGVIVRNSTYAQVGNYRSEVQAVDLPKRCEALGYRWRIYDEQGTSGKSLSAREQTQRALEDLRGGSIHGIGVLDVKRATRDEDCMDGRLIKQAVKQVRGILVTRDKVYDFRNKSDARLWDIQALQAGWEWRDIRDTTWDGIMKRAEKGGDELMLRAVPPPGYRLEINGYRKSGMPIRTPSKNPDEEELVAYIWQLFDELPSLNSVIQRLNSEGRPRPMRRRDGTRPWDGMDLRRMLDNPLYKGVIAFGRRREQARRAGEMSDVMDEFTPSEHYVPELAYVSHSTWERLSQKFKRTRGTGSKRAGSVASEHTLSGLLRCPRCGEALVGAGATGYTCRRSILGLCPGFRILDSYAEEQVCAILDDVLRKINLPENYEQALAQTDQGKNAARRSELEDELRDLGAQEDRLADAIADGLLSREAAHRKANRIQSRRAQIYLEIDNLGREQEAYERAIQYVQMAHAEGISSLVRAMPATDRRRFFQAAFKSVTLDGHGRGKWRTRSIKGYELSDPLNTFILRRAWA